MKVKVSCRVSCLSSGIKQEEVKDMVHSQKTSTRLQKNSLAQRTVFTARLPMLFSKWKEERTFSHTA